MSRRLILLTTAALAVGAAPAAATEGPVSGAPLPDTLAPVTIPRHVVAQRVLAARITPRRVAHGRHARLRVALAAPGRIQVTMHRRVRGRLVRVSTRMIAAPLGARIVRLPSRLRRGHYRVTVFALDDAGKRSPGVRRALVVA